MEGKLIASILNFCLTDVDPDCLGQLNYSTIFAIDAVDSEYQSVFVIAENIPQKVVLTVDSVEVKTRENLFRIVFFHD